MPDTGSYTLVSSNTALLVEGLISRIDGYYSERHKTRVNTTSYPVESGASLVDHAVREPYQVRLSGIVSDVLPADGSVAGVPLDQRAAQAWDTLIRAANAREPVALITRLGTYRSMLITELSAPVDQTTGLGLDVDIELTEVLLADAQVTAVTLPAPTSGPAVDRQTTTEQGRVAAPDIPVAMANSLVGRLNSVQGFLS